MVHSSARPLLSVALCTRNRAGALRRMLESLCRQTLARQAFEVVVVDDGSGDDTGEVARAFAPRLPLRYSRQRQAGLAAARNHGLFLARGTVVLFLDDDEADPHLLETHLAAHQRLPEPSLAVLGRTRLDSTSASDPLMHFATEVGCFLFAYPRLAPGRALRFGDFSAGRSSCKRIFLLRHGIFHPEFRSVGEDVELAFRLFREGFRVVYEPSATSTLSWRPPVEEFCRFLGRRGEAAFRLGRLHGGPEVESWVREATGPDRWEELAPVYDSMLRSAHELDRLVRTRQAAGLPVEAPELALLHRSYWAAFRASGAKGFADAARGTAR